MPFAILLEAALQPCGWLSSYAGSTRTSVSPLKYRNLDGKAVQHKGVDAHSGGLLTTAVLTKSSASSGMIIQEFTFHVQDIAGDDVFSGSTVFGFFPQDALERQVGAGSTEAERARLVEVSALPDYPAQFDDERVQARLEPSKLTLPARVGAPTLLMLDRVEAAWRNPRGYLRVRTSKDVVVDESLASGRELVWKYRGQVVPKNKLIQVEVDVTDIIKDHAGVTLVADGALWVDGLRIYLTKGLAIRVVDG